MSPNLAYNVYSQNNVSIESSEKLIQMLYEGILRFTSQAIRAVELGDKEKKTYWINRTVAIFSELINSLDYNAGDISHYLTGLYIHQIKTLIDANINDDISKLEQVLHVTKELLEAWKEETKLEMAE